MRINRDVQHLATRVLWRERSLRKIYDVVTIGAGPSGSSASLSAALGGADTLLIEKKREIGIPVKCGEFIPSSNEMKKLLPRASSHLSFYKMLSQEVVTNKTGRVRVYSPKNMTYEFKFEGLVLRRDVLDKILASEAEKVGVTLQTSSAVRAVVDKDDMKEILVDSAHGKSIVKAKLVIGADGFPSDVGKWEKLENGYRSEDVTLCIQQRMKNVELEDDAVEIYFGSNYAPGGYAWIIPKGDGAANVGLGVRVSYLKSRRFIINHFNAFLKNHLIASRRFPKAQRGSLIAKTLPVGSQVRRVYGNRVLLAGDAAGTVIPINGSGVPTAIVSGSIAGNVASQHLKGDCELSTYATVLEKEIGYALRRGLRYRKISDVLMYSDGLFEKVLQIIGIKNISKIIKCEPI